MRHLTKAIMLLALCLSPLAAMAQANIKAEFDKLVNCPQATITQSHSLDRDVATKQKTSQSDVYNFRLPMSKKKLIDNILAAFKRDEDMAYTYESGNTASSQDQQVALAVGDGSRTLRLTGPGRDYIYACFLAPESESPEGIYRYAYGMSWRTDGDTILGTLGVTYGTTLKHRQDQDSRYSDRRPRVSLQQDESWFNSLAYLVMGYSKCSKKDRGMYATRIYELSKQCANDSTITDKDKATARKIISNLLSSKNENSEDLFVGSVLRSAIDNIK